MDVFEYMEPVIFISVAAFNEQFLEFTIQDALQKAVNPGQLVFGVVDQYPENRRARLLRLVASPKQIRYVQVHPIESRGVCWARSIVGTLYQGEEYFLQIDSHTFFEKGWDETLLSQYRLLSKHSKKPIMSIYPFGFEFDEKMQPVIKVNVGTKTTLAMQVHPDTDLDSSNLVLRFRAVHMQGRGYVRGFHVAGGYLFTAGYFLDEVPYDPHLYFHGEEQNLAIRAFTRGWNIFHPPTIPLYHLYKQPNQAHKTHHWHPDWDKGRAEKWGELKAMAKNRLECLLGGGRLGVYGLGTDRSIQDFADYSGIDYLNRKVNRNHKLKLLKPF